jgi:spermidine synthase
VSRSRTIAPSAARLAAAFDQRVRLLPPSEPGNTVGLAAKGAPVRESFDDLVAAAECLRRETGLNLQPTLARLRPTLAGKRETFTL